jgi:hypothetical protein
MDIGIVIGLVFLGLGIATIFFAARVVMKTQRAHDERRRYEFENTTDGGVLLSEIF